MARIDENLIERFMDHTFSIRNTRTWDSRNIIAHKFKYYRTNESFCMLNHACRYKLSFNIETGVFVLENP